MLFRSMKTSERKQFSIPGIPVVARQPEIIPSASIKPMTPEESDIMNQSMAVRDSINARIERLLALRGNNEALAKLAARRKNDTIRRLDQAQNANQQPPQSPGNGPCPNCGK